MIEVTRQESDTCRFVWRFISVHSYRDELKIRLDAYLVQKRETKRHKFKTQSSWSRFSHRWQVNQIAIGDVPELSDVIDEALSMIQPIYVRLGEVS